MLGSGLRKECEIQNFETNFRPHFDAFISFNVQPIDVKLTTLVFLDFNDHLCSFLHWGCRIGIVLSRHLDWSKRKAQRCQDLVTSQYRLCRRRCKILCKKLLCRFGKGAGRVDTSLEGRWIL